MDETLRLVELRGTSNERHRLKNNIKLCSVVNSVPLEPLISIGFGSTYGHENAAIFMLGLHNYIHFYLNIGIKDILECFVMVLNYRSAEY